jgi:hypothetical protein
VESEQETDDGSINISTTYLLGSWMTQADFAASAAQTYLEMLMAGNNSWITAGTDAAGIAGLFLNGKVAKLLGPLTAAVSIYNDPSTQNQITNLLGLLEGFEAPMAIIGAFNDFLDWGAINSTPGPQKVDPYGPQILQPALPVQDECAAFGMGPSCN